MRLLVASTLRTLEIASLWCSHVGIRAEQSANPKKVSGVRMHLRGTIRIKTITRFGILHER